MSPTAIKAYHVHGRYFSVYFDSHGGPQDLGKEILAEIPSDPQEYDEWRRVTIAFYTREGKRIQRVAKDFQAYCADFEANGSRTGRRLVHWGRGYAEKPSRILPYTRNETWRYTIDIDREKLLIHGPRDAGGLVAFRTSFNLYDIDRSRFDHHCLSTGDIIEGTPVVGHVPSLRLAKPTSDSSQMIQLYKSHSPEQFTIQYVFDTKSVWKCLRLFLMRQFARRYYIVIKCSVPYRRGQGFQCRQIAYAMVSLACETNQIRFKAQSHWHDKRIGGHHVATPWWDPPDTDLYWMGGVLIVIESNIDVEENVYVAVGKAISLAEQDTDAIIFSISSIIVVRIRHTNAGIQVSHSHRIPLFAHSLTYMNRSCCTDGISMQGFYALLEILSPRRLKMHTPFSSPHLPIEICERIFDHATPATQRVLALSSRMFSTVANQYPRIGQWRLMQAAPCQSEFSAVSALHQPLQNVRVEMAYKQFPTGFEVGLWSNGENVPLDMLMCRAQTIGSSLCQETTRG